MKRRKYKPYIRIANGKEKADSLRIAYRLAFYQSLGKPFYVMVQHGFPNSAMECGPSKRSIKQSIVPVKAGWRTFRNWAAMARQELS